LIMSLAAGIGPLAAANSMINRGGGRGVRR
jgi:hypothetical protein